MDPLIQSSEDEPGLLAGFAANGRLLWKDATTAVFYSDDGILYEITLSSDAAE